jgi:hypothetical protein
MADESLEGFGLACDKGARKFGLAWLVHATIVTCLGGCRRCGRPSLWFTAETGRRREERAGNAGCLHGL